MFSECWEVTLASRRWAGKVGSGGESGGAYRGWRGYSVQADHSSSVPCSWLSQSG